MDTAASDRTFLALWPTGEVARELDAWCDAWKWPSRAARVARSRLHLTLHFLGSVPSGQVTRLRTELDVGFGDFELTLGVPAIWPRGIAVVLPLGRHKPLDALHRHLAERLKASRLPVENRPFQPHITLARRASSAIPPEQACHLKWQVCSYALVRSAGGRYTILAGFDRRRAMPRELDPG